MLDIIFNIEKKEVKVTLPDSINIFKNQYGVALKSRKFIKKGTILYTGVYYEIPDDNTIYTIYIKTSDEEILILSEDKLNSVKENNVRSLYGFDGFMNHSCDPNTFSSQTRKTNKYNIFEYDQIAIKDIEIGDEINCNYLLFDYECDGHCFLCECGSKKCFKFISGFKNCPLEEQISLMPYVENNMLKTFKLDNPDIIFQDILNENKNCKIISKNNYFFLQSLKSFKIGDILFENSIEKIPYEKKIIINIDNKYMLLDQNTHATRHKDFVAFYGFDSFTNHSCNPNCKHTFISENKYQMIAIKEINIGEEITNDYNDIESEYDTDSFICNCGYKYCRKIIN
jgi:hypothetical protein